MLTTTVRPAAVPDADASRAFEHRGNADARSIELLATLARELLLPLAPVRHGSALVEPDPDDPFELVRLRAVLSRQAGQLSELLEGLADLARVSQAALELRRRHEPLSAILESAIDACLPTLDMKDQSLTTDIAEPDMVVDVDPVRLTLVMSHLLSNAVRHAPGGGHVALVTSVDGGGLHLVVRDDGVGFEPSVSARIFEPFEPARDEARRRRQGLGIGLALSRRLVELHGGRLTADSPGPGLGSRFEVCLPLSVILPAVSREPARQPIAHRPKVVSGATIATDGH